MLWRKGVLIKEVKKVHVLNGELSDVNVGTRKGSFIKSMNLCLPLSPTHITHAHTYILPLSIYLSPLPSPRVLSLILSVTSLFLSLVDSLSTFFSVSLSFYLPHTLPLSFSLPLSLTLYLSVSFLFSVSLSLSHHPLPHTPTQYLSLSTFHPSPLFFLSLLLSLTLLPHSFICLSLSPSLSFYIYLEHNYVG